MDPQQPPPKPDEAPSAGERLRASPVTFAIAALNVAVFGWAESKGSTLDIGTLLRFGANERMHVAAGEWWRLASYMFLHIGWVHLLWNTYASLGWSTRVEKSLGKLRFIALYLLAGIGGGCASVIGQRMVSAGASGAMFGIVGANLVLRYRELGSWGAFQRDSYVRRNALNIAIWTAIGLTAVRMDNWAHGGGLVVGTLVTLAATAKATGRRIGGWTGVTVLVLVACVVAIARGRDPNEDDGTAAASYVAGYSIGTAKFPLDHPRARKLADLACSQPKLVPCAQAGWALRESDDETSKAKGRELLDRACKAGAAFACGDEPPAPAD